jgi:hypothetical protein
MRDAAKTQRRKPKPAPSSNLGASTLCAWPVAHNEWRVQSRIGPASKYLRSGLKLTRCAWAICGGHLVIFKVLGTKADAQRVMGNATRYLRENFTERAIHEMPRRGVLIS